MEIPIWVRMIVHGDDLSVQPVIKEKVIALPVLLCEQLIKPGMDPHQIWADIQKNEITRDLDLSRVQIKANSFSCAMKKMGLTCVCEPGESFSIEKLESHIEVLNCPDQLRWCAGCKSVCGEVSFFGSQDVQSIHTCHPSLPIHCSRLEEGEEDADSKSADELEILELCLVHLYLSRSTTTTATSQQELWFRLLSIPTNTLTLTKVATMRVTDNFRPTNFLKRFGGSSESILRPLSHAWKDMWDMWFTPSERTGGAPSAMLDKFVETTLRGSQHIKHMAAHEHVCSQLEFQDKTTIRFLDLLLCLVNHSQVMILPKVAIAATAMISQLYLISKFEIKDSRISEKWVREIPHSDVLMLAMHGRLDPCTVPTVSFAIARLIVDQWMRSEILKIMDPDHHLSLSSSLFSSSASFSPFSVHDGMIPSLPTPESCAEALNVVPTLSFSGDQQDWIPSEYVYQKMGSWFKKFKRTETGKKMCVSGTEFKQCPLLQILVRELNLFSQWLQAMSSGSLSSSSSSCASLVQWHSLTPIQQSLLHAPSEKKTNKKKTRVALTILRDQESLMSGEDLYKLMSVATPQLLTDASTLAVVQS